MESFLNTLDLETGADALDSAAGLRQWLVQHRLIARSAVVRSDDLRRAIELREALRRAAQANNGTAPDDRAMRKLNDLARRGGLFVAFKSDGTAELHPAPSGPDAAIAKILAAVVEAMLTGTWSRLKACANDGCRWAFYDASKNRSARWCEMADCGNDAKGRAYRQRRRSLTLSRSMRRGA